MSADSILDAKVDKNLWNKSNLQWLDKTVESPNSFPRKNHATVSFGDQLLVYGGINSNGIILDDLVSFHLTQFRWFPATQNLGSPPKPLHSHCLCVQENRNLLYVIGGYSEDGKPNTDVYIQDLSELTPFLLL